MHKYGTSGTANKSIFEMEISAMHTEKELDKEIEDHNGLTPVEDGVVPELPPDRAVRSIFDPQLSAEFLNFNFVKPTQNRNLHAKQTAQV